MHKRKNCGCRKRSRDNCDEYPNQRRRILRMGLYNKAMSEFVGIFLICHHLRLILHTLHSNNTKSIHNLIYLHYFLYYPIFCASLKLELKGIQFLLHIIIAISNKPQIFNPYAFNQ